MAGPVVINLICLKATVLYLIKHFVIKHWPSTVRSVVNELRMSTNRNGAVTVTTGGKIHHMATLSRHSVRYIYAYYILI